jgi:hypothetical protein
MRFSSAAAAAAFILMVTRKAWELDLSGPSSGSLKTTS